MEHRNQEDQYVNHRRKAQILENLALDMCTAAGDFQELHTDERKWLFQELGYLAREVVTFSFKLCERVAGDITRALHLVLTSSGHNRFDYIKMVVGNIRTEVSNLA